MKPKYSLIPTVGLICNATAASVINSGHVDSPGFGYVAGAFEPHLHLEAGAVIDGAPPLVTDQEFEPNELIVAVPASSTITVGPTTYYWLPEDELVAEDNGAPFVGLGLEELDVGDWVGGKVTITLQNFTGPGNFLLWQDDGLGGQNIFLDTANSLFSFERSAGTHSHFNWGFTENATYNLEFEISGIHQVDGSKSGSATFTYMIPEPSSTLIASMASLLLLKRRRRH